MQSSLRFLQLLSMVVWTGGLIFFAFVLAPTAFRTLPTVHLAGAVVGASLKLFDLIAVACGAVFLAVTALLFRAATIGRRRYELEFVLTGLMLIATATIHWKIIPAMDEDQMRVGGDIATAAPNTPAKIHFDTLHVLSERLEGFVLLLGLGVLFLISRDLQSAGDLTGA